MQDDYIEKPEDNLLMRLSDLDEDFSIGIINHFHTYVHRVSPGVLKIENGKVSYKQGVINEKYINENEIQRLYEEEANEQIKLMEEFFLNKKENEGFDILSFEKNEDGKYIEKYIEVKSTKGNEGTPIDITVDEINFAREHLDNYYLYRIIYSDSDKRYLKIVKGKDLLESYNFVPVVYKIYSK